jgi:hypothetical protein
MAKQPESPPAHAAAASYRYIHDEFSRSLALLARSHNLPMPLSCTAFGADGRGLLVRLEEHPDPDCADVAVYIQSFNLKGKQS